jgi:hypothetical protein
MRFKTKKQKNRGRYQRRIVSCSNKFSIHFDFSTLCTFGVDSESQGKEGRVVSELNVTSLCKPMRFKMKKQKNGGRYQRRIVSCSNISFIHFDYSTLCTFGVESESQGKEGRAVF